MTSSKAKKVRKLNDAFRAAGPTTGLWVTAPGVQMKGGEFLSLAFQAVQAFDSFNRDNDPYGHHNYGSFRIADSWLLWQIICYDHSLTYDSDPANPDITRRVMKIMLASEF